MKCWRIMTFPFRWLDWYMSPPIFRVIEANNRLARDVALALVKGAPPDALVLVMKDIERGVYRPSPPKVME